MTCHVTYTAGESATAYVYEGMAKLCKVQGASSQKLQWRGAALLHILT
jgi:hypothetical protein